MTELHAIAAPTAPIDSSDKILASDESSVAGTGYRTLSSMIISTLAAGGAVASGDLALIQQGGVVVRKAIGDMTEQDKASVGITGGAINGVVIGGTTPAAGTFTTLNTTSDVVVGDGTGQDDLRVNSALATSVQIQLQQGGLDRTVFRVVGGGQTQIRSHDALGNLIDVVMYWQSTSTADKINFNRGITAQSTENATSPTDATASIHSNGGISAEGRIVGNVMSIGPKAAYTIASGAITINNSNVQVDTEGAAASDDLDTITLTGAQDGDIITIRTANSARTVTLKDGTGNLTLSGDFTLTNVADKIMLQYDTFGLQWIELSRSNNQ